jgi:hypothetical protein
VLFPELKLLFIIVEHLAIPLGSYESDLKVILLPHIYLAYKSQNTTVLKHKYSRETLKAITDVGSQTTPLLTAIQLMFVHSGV